MRRLLLTMAALAGCTPQFAQPPSLVSGPRLLAVRGQPAEVRPGANVQLDALLVTSDGTDTTTTLNWALCDVPKPLDENNIVAGDCLLDEGVTGAGSGPSVMVTVPLDACQLFGPDPPPQMAGKPPLRPRDPDVSGGYYQPVRVETDALGGFGLERITCDLASSGAQISVEFAQRYQANTNPTLLPLAAALDGQPAALGAIPAGKKVTFTASWPADSVESYPVYDIVAQSLIDHREALRVSWFATDGTFLHEITGRGEDEMETSTDNDWTAPAAPGLVHLWIVLRDSRGGVSFAAQDVMVGP
jgi:hypothetical protein